MKVRATIAIILLIAICLALTGCGKSIVGDWKVVSSNGKGNWGKTFGTIRNDIEYHFVFTKKAFTIRLVVPLLNKTEEYPSSFSYETKGDRLIMSSDGSSDADFSIKGDTLTLKFDDGCVLVLNKVGK